jgi:predicted enzyme related to lactoylglutathione lyase
MTDTTVRGRFVWHELRTADAAAAQGFYSKVLGWQIQPHGEEEDSSRSMFATPRGPLGGTEVLAEGEPRWVLYIAVPDIEEAIGEATSRGGAVTTDITPTGSGGQYAVLTDPQGATFGIYSSSADMGPEAAPKRQEFSWYELATTDVAAALDFYSAVFGWEKTSEHDMGPLGTYVLFGRNEAPLGGIFAKLAEQPEPSWLGYVRVKDLHQTVKKVKSAGGKLINGPMEVPGGDWIAQFLDPQGVMFAVHTLAADLPAARKSAAEPQAAEAANFIEASATEVQADEADEAEDASPSPAPAKARAKKTSAKRAAAGKSAGGKKAGGTSKKKSAAAARRKPAVKAKRPAAKSARPARKTVKGKTAQAGKKRAGKKRAGKKKAAGKARKQAARRPVAKQAAKKSARVVRKTGKAGKAAKAGKARKAK